MSFLKRMFGGKREVPGDSDRAMFANVRAMAQAKVNTASAGFSAEESAKKLDRPKFAQYFLTAPTLADCRRIVDNNPDCLTDEVERMMNDVSAWAPDNARGRMNERLALFTMCRSAGVEAAFKNCGAE